MGALVPSSLRSGAHPVRVMKFIGYTILIGLSLLLCACGDSRPDAVVVEGLRELYPGGFRFGRYKDRVVSRGEEIVPELIAASRDHDAQMRESVARCLGHIGGDKAVERLLEMADDDEIEDTIWIALSYTRSAKAIPKLEEELASHSDSRSRGRLLITLAECGDMSRLDELLEMMKTSKLNGHIYLANQAFEQIAGRRFNKDTAKIEAWLKTRKPGQNGAGQSFPSSATQRENNSFSKLPVEGDVR